MFIFGTSENTKNIQGDDLQGPELKNTDLDNSEGSDYPASY